MNAETVRVRVRVRVRGRLVGDIHIAHFIKPKIDFLCGAQ
jgi:hypothetical protein